MRNSSISNSDLKKKLKSAALFCVTLLAVYALVVFTLSGIVILDLSLLQIVTGNYARVGDIRGSLQRFREIEGARDVDILFLGSSHSYASFDPRVFSESALSSFNMGSASQSPLNTYSLLKRYYERLNPKVVVYEVYFPLLSSDGLESYYDLLANQPLSINTLRMALATKNPHAITALFARTGETIFGAGVEAPQLSSPRMRYLSSGFVSHTGVFHNTEFGDTGAVDIDESQLKYVRCVLEFIRERGAEVLVVVTPLPEGRIEALTNYAEVSARLEELCRAHSVEYIDFNRPHTIVSPESFADYHHLNAGGARRFSRMIADSLRTIGAFAQRLSPHPQVALGKSGQ